MPYGYIFREEEGQNSFLYTALMDTGSSLIIVTMDAAEDLLKKTSAQIIADCGNKKPITGFGGDGIGYGWKLNLRLKANQHDRTSMSIPDAWIYVVSVDNVAGYSALFGQKTGFAQRWFKQHNHNDARYWQLREWK